MNELQPLVIQPVEWVHVGWALALLVLATLILILEFFVVSFGVLSVVSIACVVGAIYFAFLAGPVVGWLFSLATPVLGISIVRWGVERIRTSTLVPKAEVTAEAGYHHVADRMGVAPGAGVSWSHQQDLRVGPASPVASVMCKCRARCWNRKRKSW